jgi:N-acetylneuraminic acid mutarotase
MKPWMIAALLLSSQAAWSDDDWTTASAAMPTARKEINNATVVIEDEIYVVGGVASNGQITGALEIYDTVTDTWRVGADLPVPVWRSSAAVVDGQLFLFGGYLSTGSFPFSPTAASWRYDPASDTWTTLADMPSARGSLVALALNGRVHVLGGATSQPQALNQIYDPATDSWSDAAPMPAGRSGLTGSVLDGEIYLTGGYILSGGVIPQTDLFIYNPVSDEWRSAAPLPTGRLGMDAATFQSTLLVFGGAATATVPSRTLQYDPATDSWSQQADMPQAVSFMGVARVGNRIHVLGGGATNLNRFDGLAINRQYTPKGGDFVINGGHGGAWFNPETAGQGIVIEVLPALNQLFVAWFTFDAAPGLPSMRPQPARSAPRTSAG